MVQFHNKTTLKHSMVFFQRSLCLNSTLLAIDQLLTENRFSLSIDTLGFQTSHAKLYKRGEELIAEGSGKGTYHVLGAKTEAIEHYYGELEHQLSLHSIAIQRLKDSQQIISCGIIQNLISEYPTAWIPCAQMRLLHINSNNKVESSCPNISVPVTLTNPQFNTRYLYDSQSLAAYRFLKKYSTNSGTALGGTLEDALLHAILEQIERHYFSAWCEHLLHLNPKIHFSRLQRSIIDTLINSIDNTSCRQALAESNLHGIMGYSFLGVYYACIFGGHNQTFPLGFVGCGASLDCTYAINRAFDEYIQLNYLADQHTSADQHKCFNYLKMQSSLKPLIDFSQSSLFKKLATHQAYHSLTHQKMSVHHMIRTLLTELHQLGYSVLYRIKTPTSSPLIVVTIFIPGLNRFHLIRTGSRVTPQSYLQSTSYIHE